MDMMTETFPARVGALAGNGSGSAFVAPAASPSYEQAQVLDACCGSRMFWFDRKDSRAIFVDKRRESHVLPDKSSKGGARTLIIDPDIQADFTALPFADDTFSLVVFDPPHLVRNGKLGWLAKKYGKLEGDWKEELRRGFAECFRVLKPGGTLIFKWNEHDVPVSQILPLTPERPLFGNRCGKSAKSHWIVFLKPFSGSTDGSAVFLECRETALGAVQSPEDQGNETPIISRNQARPAVSLSQQDPRGIRLPDLHCVVCNEFHRFAKDCPVCGHEQLDTE